MANRPTVLMVLDGWGVAPPGSCNAIAADTEPRFAQLRERYRASTVKAHGEAVGLLDDQMGDSNVGHLTIGAGRIVPQNLSRVTRAVHEGTLEQMAVIAELAEMAPRRRIHLLGLLSPGGVHSHQEHLAALLEILGKRGASQVFLHLWLDGRDVPPQSALGDLEFLAGAINRAGVGQVATISGRYYAMDRDNRWDRTELAYRAMIDGDGERARSAPEAVRQAYERGQTDEFVLPTVLLNEEGRPVGSIGRDDAVFVFNFRADRVRQITRALADPDFDRFSRPFDAPAWIAGMTQYDANFPMPYVFGPLKVANTLAQWLSRHHKTQLHVAETEKYAHVTFFFNGGVEEPVKGEERKLISSPKVATYDQKPEMSAIEIADTVVEAVDSGKFDFILLNFANSDMVGHTGDLEATRRAVQTVDQQIARIWDAVRSRGGALVIVADHGNAERMCEDDGGANTNHTTNPVPFVVLTEDPAIRDASLQSGQLCDVAPTVLDLMGLQPPAEMEGHSLIARESVHSPGGQ